MKPKIHLFLAGAACLILADCKVPFSSKAPPRSPVVARVGPRAITLDAVDAEMTAPLPADPAARKLALNAALRNLVARDILSQAARHDGLDKTAAFKRAEARIVDTMLVQALEQKLAAEAPAPTRAQALRFISDHPDSFAQRKIFVLDQIRMARPTDPALIQALGPMKSLDQIAALLGQSKIPFQRDTAKLDAMGADPGLIAALARLAPGELFVLPQGAILSVNVIKSASVLPLTGEPAIAYAQKALAARQTQTAVQSGLRALFIKASKRVSFAKGYAGADPLAAIDVPVAQNNPDPGSPTP